MKYCKCIFVKVSEQLPARKIVPPVRIRFRFGFRVSLGGQFSSGAIVLEPFVKIFDDDDKNVMF